jgi:Dyp-type peroxidase family
MSDSTTIQPTIGSDEPVLELSDIQGNIFPGFNKSHQVLLGLKIIQPLAVKAWIQFITPEIATANEVQRFRELRAVMMQRRGHEPRGLAATWMNIAFSAEALRKLVDPADVAQFEDEAFRFDMAARATLLGDPDDTEDVEGSPKNWKVGGHSAIIPDILLIVAGDDQALLAEEVRWIKATVDQLPADSQRPGMPGGLQVIYEEQGEDLPGDLGGHEHFGFKDGISQPGIRGRLPDFPHDFFTPRSIGPANPASQLFSKPGQPLVWPGQFVFGYGGQDSRFPVEAGPEKVASPGWARNGSYLVFRRLRQDVVRFWSFMKDKTGEFRQQEGFHDMTATRLSSLLVGRWPSGAPLMRTPQEDNPALAQNGLANNHFGFAEASEKLPVLHPEDQPFDDFQPAPADPDGNICPMAAHIRKVNPRDLTTEQGNNTDVLTRRILRRGIPFGAAVEHWGDENLDPLQGNRGLLFLSYQSSIVEQFEFLCHNWMNSSDAPEEEPGGHDLIVGQNPQPGEARHRQATIRTEGEARPFERPLHARGGVEEWVITTGGGYFFAPSINALKNVLSAPLSAAEEPATAPGATGEPEIPAPPAPG